MAIEIIAHRGASALCPENTMAAFEHGLQLGATGIETDVQMSSDGRLVLIHDETLNRTAGASGWVKDTTYEQLRTLDAGSWFHADFAQERIPSLEELFDLVQGKRILLNLELKKWNCWLQGHGGKDCASHSKLGFGTASDSFEFQSCILGEVQTDCSRDSDGTSIHGKTLSSLRLCSQTGGIGTASI